MRRAHPPLSRQQALRLVEGAYLAATTGLIWLALYYLPVGRGAAPLGLAIALDAAAAQDGAVDPGRRVCCWRFC